MYYWNLTGFIIKNYYICIWDLCIWDLVSPYKTWVQQYWGNKTIQFAMPKSNPGFSVFLYNVSFKNKSCWRQPFARIFINLKPQYHWTVSVVKAFSMFPIFISYDIVFIEYILILNAVFQFYKRLFSLLFSFSTFFLGPWFSSKNCMGENRMGYRKYHAFHVNYFHVNVTTLLI